MLAVHVAVLHSNEQIINTLTDLDFRGTYSENSPLTFFPPMVFGVRVRRTASLPKHSQISSRKRSTKIITITWSGCLEFELNDYNKEVVALQL
jgi:hypothetical protein